MPSKRLDWRELAVACLIALLGWISVRSVDHGETLKTLAAKLDSVHALLVSHTISHTNGEPSHASAKVSGDR